MNTLEAVWQTAGMGEAGFAGTDSDDKEQWRSIVLFGRNVASYKFALAKSLLDLANEGHDTVELGELAVPFSRHLCEHLSQVDRQGTFAHSRFLDACRFFNAGSITAEELRETTTLLGFKNVIDAFHIVGEDDVPTRFFIDERIASGAIRLTDEMFELAARPEAGDLAGETEARWRLVEEAWDAKADGQQVTVLYDSPSELLVPALKGKRKSITEVRPALNGYQQGHCFYCYRAISFTSPTAETAADVDHFFPHVLMSRGLPVDLDLPWNLVLACANCNRGPSGKSASLPHDQYLRRLSARNEWLIASHHPLREMIIMATGTSQSNRRRFLIDLMSMAGPLLRAARWNARDEGPAVFG